MLFDVHTPLTELHFVEASSPKIQYYRLRWDWETDSEYNGHIRPIAAERGAPGVLNFQQMQHNPMNEAWQKFWFSLNQTGDAVLNVKAWNTYANSQAFLTDGWGVDKYKNFITRENLDQPDLPRIETKGCCGNVVCIDENVTMVWSGITYVKIVTLDLNSPPPFGITYQSHPHLIHHATVLAPSGSGYVCNPFPHLGGRNTGIPVYFPVTSRGNVFYPLKYLQKLPLDSPIPNPYFPPMS